MPTVTVSERYLVMCDAGNNNNKYYRMHPNGDTFTVDYGRVGAGAQHATYPISQFSTKYNEKIRKGYQDVTDVRSELVPQTNMSGKSKQDTSTEFSDITDAGVRELVRELQAYAVKTLRANYRVSSMEVTQRMVDAVSGYLRELDMLLAQYRKLTTNQATMSDIPRQFDAMLQQRVFTTIPRVMSHVDAFIIAGNVNLNDQEATAVRMARIIDNERSLLDIMRTKVVQNTVTAKTPNDSTATLKALGLEITPCTDKDIALIRKELGSVAPRLCGAWCVKNIRTHEAFEKFKRDHRGSYQRFPSKLLWHGSRNENWWSIINSGLKLSPQNAVITGKMFGRGIYFAPKAQKSVGYTSVPDAYWNNCHASNGFLALYATAYGKAWDVDTNREFTSQFDWNDLQRKCPGAHCVHAHAGKSLRNDEIIFYNESQCTIKYIVKIK